MDKKPVVSQAAMEYYEFYKDTLTSFAEWFQDDLEESPSHFEKDKEVLNWLYDVDYETQKQRELALAILIVNGPEAVEVEKEKLYTVEIPNPNSAGGKTVLSKQQSTGRLILQMLNSNINKPKYLHLTESEIKQDFEWAWKFAEEVEE